MDENKEVNTTDPKREKVRVIPLSAIDDAPDHPFGVRDDEEMAELVESISTFGVINPVIVRKGEGERYELTMTAHTAIRSVLPLGIAPPTVRTTMTPYGATTSPVTGMSALCATTRRTKQLILPAQRRPRQHRRSVLNVITSSLPHWVTLTT